MRWLIALSLGLFLAPAFASAAEPVTLASVQDPGPNRLDEPLAGQFSLERAVHFLDSASLTWQKDRKCFTCHTNYAYLYARPLISSEVAAHAEVRKFAEELVEVRWKDPGPRWDAEVVATAAALAFNDRLTTGKLHATTRTALDRIWQVQREDGGFDWLKCDWPPMESDDEYGATLAALAVSVAPESYRQTPQARAGLEKLRGYLVKTPPPMAHHRAMLLWASSYDEKFLTEDQRRSVIEELLKLQRADGGWSLPSLGKWEREDKSEQDTSSDGYGTGFVAFVLKQAGMPSDAEPIRRGLSWLKQHQRESGRWITRSLHTDNKHFISHCGTAFAVMAIVSAESQPQASKTE
jgi:squalene-hopene/tetraprenyl-beta-curcumene cyclase